MKSIAPKDAFKLFLFMLILLSAKTFSHPKLPSDSNTGDSESRIGSVTKKSDKKVTTSNTYSSSSKDNATSKKHISAKASLKVGIKK